MSQTVLPFKLATTDETLTAHGGLAILGEYLESLGFSGLVDRALPAPGSAVGYAPSRFVTPLVVMLHGGGRSLEDLRVVHGDSALRDLLGWEALPSTDAVGDWLRRQGLGAGLTALEKVHRHLLRRALRGEAETGYTLDIDATQIVAHKREAARTYKGERGYMPMVGHLAENGLVAGHEFRPGNDSPGARNLPFIQHCAAQLPKDRRIGALRADSASYQAAVFNYCESRGMKFAVGADLDAGVRATIAAIPESDWRPYQDGHLAETVHSMNKTDRAFRLIVIRRPVQRELFEEGEPTERTTVIASNREESAEDTVAWYNRRGETSENRIKELKIGFGMERMPCGELEANAMWFGIGALAYNLFVMFKQRALPASWRKHQVQTVRWRLYQTAGKVVRHGRRVILRVSASMHGLLETIRAASREIAAAPT